MTKGGYVDSSRRVRSLHRQQDDLHQSSPLRGGLLAAINKSSLSSSSAPAATSPRKLLKLTNENELPSVISISKNLEHKQKEHDKQMRLIEVYLIMTNSS